MISATELNAWRAPLLAARQRRLLVWNGSRATGLEFAVHLAQLLPRHRILTDQSLDSVAALVPSVTGKKPVLAVGPVTSGKRHLGQECDLVVLDGWAGFDPESFAALCGVLVAGGLLLLIKPDQWADYPDPDYQRLAPWPLGIEAIKGRFLRRFEQVLLGDADVLFSDRADRLPSLAHLAPVAALSPWPSGALTHDQANVVEALCRAVSPQVVLADRGRGKSAALGLLIAHHLRLRAHNSEAPATIQICAPRKAAVASALELARRQLGLPADAPLCTAFGRCDFFAPDQLLAKAAPASLLLIDEAAAIPVPILTALLKRQLKAGGQLVFATTVHGYEGTGRGFAVRFQRVLTRLAPGWQTLRLGEPIRWAANDPLERLCFEGLLLDAEPERAPQGADLKIERLDRSALARDDALLSALFGLLVQAHYQTSPNDLRQLLDSPEQEVWVARAAGVVVATAWVAREGGFDPALSRQIWAGVRRPRGHLLAQSLAAHAGWSLAPRLRGLRVMRIATAERWQRQGVGLRLLAALERAAKGEGLDWLGSSFSASADVVAFWQRAGFAPVRLGLARDTCSGSYALHVLKGVSSRGAALARMATGRFYAAWPPCSQQLEPALFKQLAPEPLSVLPSLLSERQDWLDLIAFAFGQRAFESVEAQVVAVVDQLPCHTPQEAELVRRKFRAFEDWKTTACGCGLPGKKAAIAMSRGLIERYLECHLPARWRPLLAIFNTENPST